MPRRARRAVAYHARVPTAKRIALAAGTLVGVVLYVWFAAVRAVPLVRRRKAERRAEREVARVAGDAARNATRDTT